MGFNITIGDEPDNGQLESGLGSYSKSVSVEYWHIFESLGAV